MPLGQCGEDKRAGDGIAIVRCIHQDPGATGADQSQTSNLSSLTSWWKPVPKKRVTEYGFVFNAPIDPR